jgi:hypothetical protein
MRTLKYFLAIVSLSAIALAPTTPVLAQGVDQSPASCIYDCLEKAASEAQLCAPLVGPGLSDCLDGVRADLDACVMNTCP